MDNPILYEHEIKFQERLKKLMKERELNQRELALSSEIGFASICEYINTTELPSRKNLIKLADFFDVSCDYLVGTSNKRGFRRKISDKTFGEIIDEFVYGVEGSVYQFSKHTKIYPCVYYSWRKGVKAGVQHLIVLSKHYGVSIEYLLGRAEK